MAKQGNRDRLNPRHCPSLELDSLTGRRSSDSIRTSGNDCAAPKGRIDDCKPNPLLITKTTCNQGASIDDNAAKRVFQLYWVQLETGEIMDLKLTREKFLEHFATRAPCLISMVACGGSQHWARRLRELGHEVRLLPAKMVRPFVGGNKSDAHDARAIWTAVQHPGIKIVAIKCEEQQAVLALHRMRQQLVKFRTAQINGLRGLLAVYGEVMPPGRAGMRRGMAYAVTITRWSRQSSKPSNQSWSGGPAS